MNDPTGNRRIIPVELISRDYELSDLVDREDLWAQLTQIYFEAVRSGDESAYKSTSEDYKTINLLSEDYQLVNVTRELIEKHFENASDRDLGGDVEFLTASDMTGHINNLEQKNGHRINSITLGKECGQKFWEILFKVL